MYDPNIKVQVGQIWYFDDCLLKKYPTVKNKITKNKITAVDTVNLLCYSVKICETIYPAEVFGFLTSDLCPLKWHQDWCMEGTNKVPAITSNGVVINDHVCPTCDNDRCSKNETICWRCGHKL